MIPMNKIWTKYECDFDFDFDFDFDLESYFDFDFKKNKKIHAIGSVADTVDVLNHFKQWHGWIQTGTHGYETIKIQFLRKISFK